MLCVSYYNTHRIQFVAISSGGLVTRDGYKDSREVMILFEETFFNQRDESYRVLCLEQPLEGGNLLARNPLIINCV